MLLTVIIILLLSLFLYLLFIPIIMVIDTRNNRYYIQLKGLAKANVMADEKELLKIKLRMLFFNFNFYPLKKKSIVKNLERQSKLPKKKSKNVMKFKTGFRVFKTFKIKQFYLNIDTGDCITNAKLYALFAFLKMSASRRRSARSFGTISVNHLNCQTSNGFTMIIVVPEGRMVAPGP